MMAGITAFVFLSIQALAPAATVVTPVTLDRLADDFDQICVRPGGDEAAMKVAADHYLRAYPGSDRPSYGAMKTKKSVDCFVFGSVVSDADLAHVRDIATRRFGATLKPGRAGRATGEIVWRSSDTTYQGQVADQQGRHVALFSVSFSKGNR